MELIEQIAMRTEDADREFLIEEISSSFLWLNIYNNSYVLNSLIKSAFDSAGLPFKSLNEISIAHFLIHCIEQNVCANIEKILGGFAFNLHRVQEENRSTIHGSINWGSTIQRRIANGYSDRTLFVITSNSRDNDTVSNQLVRFLLTKIIICTNTITENRNVKSLYDSTWINLITQQSKYAKKILSHPKIQAVSLIRKLDYRHIETTLGSRIVYYRIAAKCANLYYNIFIKKSMESIRELILKRVLIPVETSTIYEFAVLFKILGCFEKKLKYGDSKKYVVLRSTEQTIFEYAIGQTQFRIYYQTVPFNLCSKQYSSCLKQHGYIGSSLRPDIFVTSEGATGNKQRIVEVKYSLRESYTYEGLKDVLAYLYDFPDVEDSDDGAIILATYIRTPAKRIGPNKVWIAGYEQLEESIDEMISKMG